MTGGEAKKIRSFSDTEPIEILNHFGIKQEDLFECTTRMALNKEWVREQTGIAFAEKLSGLKKARVIIDYDADFDFIIMRIAPL